MVTTLVTLPKTARRGQAYRGLMHITVCFELIARYAYDSLLVKPTNRVSKFADPKKLFPYPDDLAPTQPTTDELSALL